MTSRNKIIMDEKRDRNAIPLEIEVSDEDIYEAMKDVQGYLDITPSDMRELYKLAYRHAFSRITSSVRAKDIMTAKVFSVKKTTPIQEVADLMAAEGISGVPVLDENGRIAGVISEKDFLSSMGAKDRTHFMGVVAECLKGGCVALPVRRKKAEDLMSTPPVTVGEETTVTEIARLFDEKNINRVPVIDQGGNLRGIVSRGDIVRAASYRQTAG